MNAKAFSFRASDEVKRAATKLERKFDLLDETFWMYNLPVQIDVERDEKGNIDLDTSIILNYMYRRFECRTMRFREVFNGLTPSKKDLENFAIVVEALIKNLGRQFAAFGKGKTEYVISAN